jgi:AraC-like DNA-binding protein
MTRDANRDAKCLSILRRIRQASGEPLRISSIAYEFGVAPATLIRICRLITGLTPARYRSCLRIEAAKRLLLTTDRSITDIALDVGYSSLGTFIRTFTELVGVSPTRFRGLSKRLTLEDVLAAALGNAPAPIGPHPGARLVCGVVPHEVGAEANLTAVGVFADAVPVGRPLSGCVLLGCGHFELVWPATNPQVHVLALRMPMPPDAVAIWLPKLNEISVSNIFLRWDRFRPTEPALIDLVFRTVAEADPPIVAPLPILLGLSEQA